MVCKGLCVETLEGSKNMILFQPVSKTCFGEFGCRFFREIGQVGDRDLTQVSLVNADRYSELPHNTSARRSRRDGVATAFPFPSVYCVEALLLNRPQAADKSTPHAVRVQLFPEGISSDLTPLESPIPSLY